MTLTDHLIRAHHTIMTRRSNISSKSEAETSPTVEPLDQKGSDLLKNLKLTFTEYSETEVSVSLDMVVLRVEPERLVDVCELLKSNEKFLFNYLILSITQQSYLPLHPRSGAPRDNTLLRGHSCLRTFVHRFPCFLYRPDTRTAPRKSHQPRSGHNRASSFSTQ